MNQKQIAIGMLAMSVIAASTAFAAPAKPSTMQITLDGKLVGLSGYEIADNNYFKLRDLAYALCQTSSRFSVDFDGKTIALGTGKEYVPVGGEMTIREGTAADAKYKQEVILVNQQPVSVTGYEIDGYNYFKLRDMGEALQFDVDFDADSRTVMLQSKGAFDKEIVPQEEPNMVPVPDKQTDVGESGVGESGTPAPEEQTEESDVEAVLALMNDAREKEGAAALKLDEDLCKAAQIRAEEIAELFSHTRPDGTSCFTVLREIGWSSYGMVGENIAMGQRTPESVMDSWMNSQGHRENILNEAFTAVGIARYQNGWVQLFVG